jgi:hypothetical protein
MKRLIAALLGAALLSGCFGIGVATDKMTVTVKQVIPLPTGTVIEVSAPLELNGTDIHGIFNDILKSNSGNRITENTAFVIPVVVANGNFDYEDTTISLDYSGAGVTKLIPYSASRNPLSKREDGRYDFDEELKASQTTELLIAGMTGDVPEGFESASMHFNVTVYAGNGSYITSEVGSLTIVKAD